MAKLLLRCRDVVGKTMAGPAIRYWELAKALSKNHQVTLQIPEISISSPQFRMISSKESIDYRNYDVLISQRIDPLMALQAKRNGVSLIYDAYDPEPLEHMEIYKASNLKARTFLNKKIINTINFSLEMADGFLCANQKQRDLWIGSLLSLKKINPQFYDRDSALEKLMAIVPFGISSQSPKKTKDGFRKLFNIKDSDKLLIWGGGIWNWFDPLTLINAMKVLSERRKDIKLVFMGLLHPHAKVIPGMNMASEAKNLAKTLGLLDSYVFFNEVWIPYEERENYLLEANLGISTHFEHLETHYSFRTRLLDYMWAGLPIVATCGDTFGDLIEKHRLGITVPSKDVQALVKAIENVMDRPDVAQSMRANIEKLKSQFFWENIIHPIDEMVEFLTSGGPSKLSFQDLRKILGFTWNKVCTKCLKYE